MIAFFLSICLLLSPVLLTAQEETKEIHFDIILFKKKVGWMKASYRKAADGTMYYRLESRSGAKFLWIDRDVYSVYDTEYRNGRLIRSHYRETDKGVLKKLNKVHWTGSQYVVEKLEGKGILGGVPETGVIQLFFNAPKNLKMIFNESEACFEKVVYDKNCLKFKGGEGQTNCYCYQGNNLDQASCEFSFATVHFVRSNP